MSVINTNITAMIAQQNLGRSQSALQTSMERLSSGLRINSAKDDAAGQAIANRMSSQISGLMQAQRNANDGISIAQTTEGALNEINNNLQRVRELTVQAANGTNNGSDLESIQNEIGQRLNEINRVSAETSFNGVKVLAADSTVTIQVGSNDGETISLDLRHINSKTLGLEGFNVDGNGSVANKAAAADDLVLNGFTKGASNTNGSVTYSKDTANTAATAGDLFSALATGDTVTYTGTDTGLGVAASTDYTYDAASNSFTFDVAGADAADVEAALAPAAGGSVAASITIGGSAQDVLIDSNGMVTAADDGAVLYLDGEGNLTKNNAGGETQAELTDVLAALSAGDSVQVGDTTYTSDGTDFDVTGASISASGLQNLAVAANGTTAFAVTLDGDTYDVEIGGEVQNAANAAQYLDNAGALTDADITTTTYYAQASGAVTDDTGASLYVDGEGELTASSTTVGDRTEDPLAVLDSALSQIDGLRSDLGAIQNRFESTITNLGNTSTNLSAARSRIEDADYAVEVSNMTRAQILQQAGTSVLAQANQVPQSVLSLLR